MKRDDLERTLSSLRAPEPPPDMRERCLATIPGEIRAERGVGKERWDMRRWSAVAAVLASVILVGVIVTSRPRPTDGRTAFAATVQAMQKVAFYHVKGREQGCYPDGGGHDGDGWYSGRWIDSESWFDAERGSLGRTSGQTFMHQQSLELPNGTIYDRDEDRLKITTFTPARWKRNRNAITAQFTDLGQTAHGFAYDTEPRLVATAEGDWKGRKAARLTFEAVSPPDKAKRGAPTVRTLYFLDPTTRRIIAKQQFARSAGGGETLVAESEFDYDERPDPALFDPKRIEQGVTRIQRQKGGPGVVLSPDEP